MTKKKLYPVVSLPNINISISKNSHFSIGTSPYYAHQNAVAIDIYDQISIDNYDVVSPISGKVVQIKEMQAPKPKFKDGIDKEYLTLIQNPDDNNSVFKILHIKPELDLGQIIEPGDYMGKTIRNGYFAPWSSPHIHLELKKPEEALRAKEGLHFNLNTKEVSSITPIQRRDYFEHIPIIIEFICDEFFLCRFPDDLYFYIDPFYGVKGNDGDVSFIIDGGIPQYKHGIIHLSDARDSERIKDICLNSLRIGVINRFHEKYGFFDLNKIKFLLNNKKIRGISLFLSKNRPFIKLIPFYKEDFEITLKSKGFLIILSE